MPDGLRDDEFVVFFFPNEGMNPAAFTIGAAAGSPGPESNHSDSNIRADEVPDGESFTRRPQ